jgi:hypothetical protein
VSVPAYAQLAAVDLQTQVVNTAVRDPKRIDSAPELYPQPNAHQGSNNCRNLM